MSQYSETIGSFTRTGNYPLEANYIFQSEEELKQFYSDPIQKTTLHEGLFKIVKTDNEQFLYWVVNGENGLEFKKLDINNVVYVGKLLEDVESINDELNAKDSEIAQINTKLSEHTSNILSLNTEVPALQSKVDVNTTSISQINNTIAGHEESIAQINTKLSEHTASISENKIAVEKNTSDIKNVSDTVDAQAAKLANVDTTLENALFKNKGYFTTLEKLNEAVPNPTIGSKAYVGTSEPYAIYIVENGVWVDSGYTGGDEIVANITTDRISDGAVTSEKIATSAFDSTLSLSGKIAPADVVGEKITKLNEKVDTLALGAFYGYFPDSISLPTDISTPGYAYVGLDNPYKIWNFNGESWSDSGTSIDMNDADEEDITRNSEGKLQFKGRPYGDGMGYVILRKDKTFAEQVTQVNTIYEIRYDFNLGGEETSIGSNSILKFCGGKLKNGTLKGANTYIDAPNIVCFTNDVNFIGSFKNSILHADWIEKESTYSAASAINKFTNNSIFDGKTVVLDSEAYYLNTPIILRSCISLLGANQTYARNTIGGNSAFNGKGIIALVLGTLKNCKISNLTFDLTNVGTNAIYSNFEVEHLTVEDCNFANIHESFAAIMMDEYTLSSVSNGCNAINVYRNKFSGDGYGIVNVNGGDNCNIRDNNFISKKNSCIKWNGISGTASVNIENNAIVGGGEALIDVSNVMTHTIRNNQIEVMTPIVSDGIKNCVICIGSETFRNYCNHLEIAHNNINLKTGSLTSPGTEVAIWINWVFGALISNNNVSNAKTYIKGSENKGYASVLIIDNASVQVSQRPDYDKNNFFIDPATRFTILDFYNGSFNLGTLKLQYVFTSSEVKEQGVISQKTGDSKRFVTYDARTGAICDLNGYPSTRSGTTALRKTSSLPDYLKGGVDMTGFCYFDTTLGKPVWFKGLDVDNNPIWVDAAGEVVA